MKTIEAIDYCGGVRALADFLDHSENTGKPIWPQAIYGWGDEPPMSRQYELEIKTGGKLKARRK